MSRSTDSSNQSPVGAFPQNLGRFVDRILTNDLLFDIIFDACTPASIARLSLTCRIAYGAVKSYLTRACDVNGILSRYFPEPLEFRSLQRRTGALVSGSTALQLFLRERYPDSDLDVYVRKDVREEVARWVLAQGYRYKPSKYQSKDFEVAIAKPGKDRLEENRTYAFHGISFVFTFVKPSEHDPDKELQVQIIVATHSPMDVILAFHTTAVMNVIAWDWAYCLYPLATMEHREAACLRSGVPRTDDALKKYAARGFKIHHDISDPFTLALLGGLVTRYIGDESTWALRLPTDDVSAPEHELVPARDPSVCTVWRMIFPHHPQVWTTVVQGEEVGLSLNYMDCDDYLWDLINEVKDLLEWEDDEDDDAEIWNLEETFIQHYVAQLIQWE